MIMPAKLWQCTLKSKYDVWNEKMIAAASDISLINRREAPYFLMRLSSVFGKKSGGFYKERNLKAL